MSKIPSLRIAILVCLIATPIAVGQDRQSINLLQSFDPASQIVAGTWTMADAELQVAASKAARCILATNVPTSYDITFEFTRTEGDDAVALILPIGDVSPALEISSWQGEVHGLARVNGGSSRDASNPTTVRPGTIENGKRQELLVSVRAEDNSPTITATLNGTELLKWSGPTSALASHFAFNLPNPRTLGMAVQNSAVTIHRASLEAVGAMQPAPTPTSPATPKRENLLSNLGRPGTPGWEPFNQGQFQVATEAGREILKSVPGSGSGDRGAFLQDVEFSTGTLSIDLKGNSQPGSSFLGVVFRGVDGDTYDAVYFRTFNFGHSDSVRRGHAVQYMSHPDFDWAKLRAERPEEFENPANPEPGSEDWFSARVEVEEQRVRVFVNGATEPCLDVEALGSVKSGKVGIWFNGIASFANLKVEANP